jgi:hypothetical protein
MRFAAFSVAQLELFEEEEEETGIYFDCRRFTLEPAGE